MDGFYFKIVNTVSDRKCSSVVMGRLACEMFKDRTEYGSNVLKTCSKWTKLQGGAEFMGIG